MPNDVYFKAGLLTTVGLSTKNAILIIGFALDLMKEGKGLIESILEAVKLRLRPILMTSMAFVLGVLPLVLSTGVSGGMISGTFLALSMLTDACSFIPPPAPVLFPSISLTSNGDASSRTLTGLFANGTARWLFAPQVNIPIFSGGKNEAGLKSVNLYKALGGSWWWEWRKKIRKVSRDDGR